MGIIQTTIIHPQITIIINIPDTLIILTHPTDTQTTHYHPTDTQTTHYHPTDTQTTHYHPTDTQTTLIPTLHQGIMDMLTIIPIQAITPTLIVTISQQPISVLRAIIQTHIMGLHIAFSTFTGTNQIRTTHKTNILLF